MRNSLKLLNGKESSRFKMGYDFFEYVKNKCLQLKYRKMYVM